MRGYLKLLRIGNCVMGIIAVIIAAIIVLGDPNTIEEFIIPIILASFTVFSFTGAGNALNDYFDRDIDKINHPKRPIPSGNVSLKNALIISTVLFIIALILSKIMNYYCTLIVIINLIIMLSYEKSTKNRGLAGNLSISWLTASIFIFGGFSVYEGSFSSLDTIWVLALLSFFATLGREISKDIQDVKGDKTRTTLPKRIGIYKARIWARVSFGLAVVMSPIPYIHLDFEIMYLGTVMVANAIFIYSAVILKKSPRIASGGAKIAMLIALMAFLIGGLI